MAKYESSVRELAYPQASVYAKLSDLSNLAAVKEKLQSEDLGALTQGKVSEEQLQKAKEQLESLTFTTDSFSVNVPPVGQIAVRIVERTPDKCVKFESEQSPVPLKFWIQILPTSSTSSKMKLTLDAALNPFIKMMADKPLREGVEKLADMLAAIPYE